MKTNGCQFQAKNFSEEFGTLIKTIHMVWNFNQKNLEL